MAIIYVLSLIINRYCKYFITNDPTYVQQYIYTFFQLFVGVHGVGETFERQVDLGLFRERLQRSSGGLHVFVVVLGPAALGVVDHLGSAERQKRHAETEEKSWPTRIATCAASHTGVAPSACAREWHVRRRRLYFITSETRLQIGAHRRWQQTTRAHTSTRVGPA